MHRLDSVGYLQSVTVVERLEIVAGSGEGLRENLCYYEKLEHKDKFSIEEVRR